MGTSTLRFGAGCLGTLLLLGAGVEEGSASARGERPAAGSETCRHCHRFSDRLSHPIGVSLSMDVDSALPLERGRRVGCLTCHDERRVHGDRLESPTRSASLRLPVRELCSSCHRQADPAGRPGHGAAMLRAHLGIDREVRLASSGFDRETHGCLGCHDGSVARRAPTEIGSHGVANGRLAGSHPVGRSYPAARFGYRPRAALPPEVRLPAGTVGCTSCHSPYSRADAMLTVSNRKSRLCLTCHVK